MATQPAFYRYVGVQGIAFLGLTAGYIAAAFAGVTLPEGYTELTSVAAGFFFAKNGPNVVSKLRPN